MSRVCNITSYYGRLRAVCVLGLGSAMLAACATLWVPAEHGVSLEVAGTDKARITNVDVFRRDNGLRLVGEVDIDTEVPMLMEMPGHVDILVESPGGGVGSASYRPDGYRHIHDHDVTYQRFSFAVDIPGFPPKGSVIHLIYRAGEGVEKHDM